jgi:asparagine synthase (glutamine-hydrolysing)
MARIAGIFKKNKSLLVSSILEKMIHCDSCAKKIFECENATLGVVYTKSEEYLYENLNVSNVVCDGLINGLIDDFESIVTFMNTGILNKDLFTNPITLAAVKDDDFLLLRDALGINPLYYCVVEDTLVFSSEVKVLTQFSNHIEEFPPGFILTKKNGFKKFYEIKVKPTLDQKHWEIIDVLYNKIILAIGKYSKHSSPGIWLSGGLDSSILVALTRQYFEQIQTFSVGLENSPDLEYARLVADHFNTTHHELIFTIKDLYEILPKVIYHLESFDALLVRSSLANFILARESANYVETVLTGDGGDELFAGYLYLKDIYSPKLPYELVELIQGMHNTALQRVDRAAACYGIKAFPAFLDLEIVNYALTIPSFYKICSDNGKLVEKWILRKSMVNELPEKILWREKMKFWIGTGIKNIIEKKANETISDSDFSIERQLKDGSFLNSKEELLYFRIFKEFFGGLSNYRFVGRTKSHSSNDYSNK